MKRGFTLVELLVVVLIIGILSAIAIPMYQGAVDKSDWSTMLPGAKALKDAEEAVRMSNGLYTANMDNLDVRMPNGDVQYTLETVNDDGTANVVRATSTKLPTVRLSNYLDENVNFAGQLHCEVKDGNERATRLCEKLLGGQYIMPVDGGYTAYLLDQEIDQATCNHAEQSWSTSKTKCYRTHESRCDALDSGYLGDGQCGINNGNGKTFGAETICNATTGGCDGAIIENGGECVTWGGDHITNNTPCRGAKIKDGGICRVKASSYSPCSGVTIENGGMCIMDLGGYGGCVGSSNIQGAVICKSNGGGVCGYGNSYDGGICVSGPGGGCVNSTYENGAICYANAGRGCGAIYSNEKSTYKDTSCCCGQYCPDYAPKCAASRCDPQYMSYNNFKDL